MVGIYGNHPEDKARERELDRYLAEPEYEVELFSAEEVADDILDNGTKNFDWTDWQTLTESDKAQAFDELIEVIAGLKVDHALTMVENRAEYYEEIISKILYIFHSVRF